MGNFQFLEKEYGNMDFRDFTSRQKEYLREGLKSVDSSEIHSCEEGKQYIELLRKFRTAVEYDSRNNGDNYQKMLHSLLSVGEDGVYSDSLHFIFELIQNVDDCDYSDRNDCSLEMQFDVNADQIILRYNETGFTPYNVFAITGIAEAAKNITSGKTEIGEKGIGFKSVFGVADRVRIQSGWFAFDLDKKNFTIPVPVYEQTGTKFQDGTVMTLFLSNTEGEVEYEIASDETAETSEQDIYENTFENQAAATDVTIPRIVRKMKSDAKSTRAWDIYRQIKKLYCNKNAIFKKNPILFLNKLTRLMIYQDKAWRFMEFSVTRNDTGEIKTPLREKNVVVSVNLRDHDMSGRDVDENISIHCIRYSNPMTWSREACQSRYGKETKIGEPNGRTMLLQAVVPVVRELCDGGSNPAGEKLDLNGVLYSFLPTQLTLTIPMALHVPFKLDASREFVDPQEKNLWFMESCGYLQRFLETIYLDLRKEVKRDIVRYLPSFSGNIFAPNNGKEKCLTGLRSFEGEHYLQMPVFQTVSGRFRNANQIYYFDQGDRLKDPEKIDRLFGHKAGDRELFLPPADISMRRFSIASRKGALADLFRRAMLCPEITREALSYLDEEGYFDGSQIVPLEDMCLTLYQIRMIHEHESLLNRFQEDTRQKICGRRRITISLSMDGVSPTTTGVALGEEADVMDAPVKIQNYLKTINDICVLADLKEGTFFACSNALILSSRERQKAFVSFCEKIEPQDPYTIRIRLRNLSRELNEVEANSEIPTEEYMRRLAESRKLTKDCLGEKAYKRYHDLLLSSGMDRNRFLLEILQNADDCFYAERVVPSFHMKLRDGVLTVNYNELGFSRANVRAITSIGDSTKTQLLSNANDAGKIGEKGIGFKAVFGAASEVRISSGEFHFKMTAELPTIPQSFDTEEKETAGTRMEFVLRNGYHLPELDSAWILQTCCCLRQLKEIEINGHYATIEDTENYRVITIDGRKRVFRRITHKFEVKDAAALEERRDNYREVSLEQAITCYVPTERKESYPVYVGLPTNCEIRIPLVIDAPFALTTSREEIDVGGFQRWNALVRSEMYYAILKVIETLKRTERADVLRFVRGVPRRQGVVQKYVYAIAGDDTKAFINNQDFLNDLRRSCILPTYERNLFSAATDPALMRYPSVAHWLFRKNIFYNIPKSKVVDADSSKQDETVLKALNALEVPQADFSKVLPLLQVCSERFIKEAEFRTLLYDYLQENATPAYYEHIRRMPIIPVFTESNGEEKYVSWEEDQIFVRDRSENGQIANNRCNYYLLNEAILPRATYERMSGVTINEMNRTWERGRYQETLEKVINTYEKNALYVYLLREFQEGVLHAYSAKGVLQEHLSQGKIPLKNQLGEITTGKIFLNDQDEEYFPVDVIKSISAHRECRAFARYLGCGSLSDVHYEDFAYEKELVDDDIESLKDDYFKNGDEILRGFYRNGQCSEELMQDYQLKYLTYDSSSEDSSASKYEFPEKPVGNVYQIRNAVNELCRNPARIVSAKVERSVRQVVKGNGTRTDLDHPSLRGEIIEMYTPDGATNRCFCQCCQKVKLQQYIEVNNLELLPEYYFPQMRIALCLECSKYFEDFRQNDRRRKEFLKAIRNAKVGSEGYIDVPLGTDRSIRFTGEHLVMVKGIMEWISAQQPEKNE